MLFFIKKILKIRYLCRFQGFSKLLPLFHFSRFHLFFNSWCRFFQQLLQYFLRLDVCLINLLFHNIENADILLKNFSQSAIHAGLQDFLIANRFTYFTHKHFLIFVSMLLPTTLAIFPTVWCLLDWYTTLY
jgi:hypothetical protein